MPLGTFMGLATSALNNAWAQSRENEARRQNYLYSEMAANNADKRTRAMYESYYSPSAQIRQLREAGLSPSLFFGGQGASGMSVNPNGAQGNGSNGISPNMHFIDPLTAAQIDNIKADTENKKENTEGKSIENEVKMLESKLFREKYDLLNTYYWNFSDGSNYSLYEDAQKFDNFTEFLQSVRAMRKRGGLSDELTTNQVQLLNEYFNTTKKLSTEVNTLQLTNAENDLQKAIIKALNKQNYANLNAEQIAGNLKATIAQAELDEEQRNAWNKVIDSIENENAKAAIIVISMILDRMASVYRTTPNITMNKNRQIRSNE